IIPNQQDIARFTKVYAISRDTVEVETITQNRKTNQIPGVRKHFNRLAILAWSLQKEQIEFTEDAYALIEQETKMLVEKYHQSIPLIEKGRAFDKLAKLSIPIAVLCGSFQEVEGRLRLNVDTHHVGYAVQHLQETYDAPAMGYDRYSSKERVREYVAHPRVVSRALQEVQSVPTEALVQHLLSIQVLTRQNLEEVVGERLVAAALWSTLTVNHC